MTFPVLDGDSRCSHLFCKIVTVLSALRCSYMNLTLTVVVNRWEDDGTVQSQSVRLLSCVCSLSHGVMWYMY